MAAEMEEIFANYLLRSELSRYEFAAAKCCDLSQLGLADLFVRVCRNIWWCNDTARVPAALNNSLIRGEVMRTWQQKVRAFFFVKIFRLYYSDLDFPVLFWNESYLLVDDDVWHQWEF